MRAAGATTLELASGSKMSLYSDWQQQAQQPCRCRLFSRIRVSGGSRRTGADNAGREWVGIRYGLQTGQALHSTPAVRRTQVMEHIPQYCTRFVAEARCGWSHRRSCGAVCPMSHHALAPRKARHAELDVTCYAHAVMGEWWPEMRETCRGPAVLERCWAQARPDSRAGQAHWKQCCNRGRVPGAGGGSRYAGRCEREGSRANTTRLQAAIGSVL